MPSLVGRRDLNSFDYDRGGPMRMNGMAANGGFDHYRDNYSREDMRRDEDDRYRRGVRNGGPSFDRFNTDYLDQNSLSDFRSNEPKFELDHLATFAAGSRNGVIHAEDGLRKLRQMENTTGIWTMRCILIVERNYVVVFDNSTGEELERFPIQLVQDPTAVFKNDRREIYNNLILFTVIDDPKKRTPQADMHIFQSSKAPAQEIVDEILAAKSGQQRLYPGGGTRIPPPPAGPAPEPPGNAYDFHAMRDLIDSRQYQSNATTDVRQFKQFNQTSYSQGGQFGGPIGQQRSLIQRVNTVRERESIEGTSTEILERDVQLLNHCFDDIEKFVARLQQAAESYKELEKRKRDRGAKNKKRQSGDGMLNARARPPPDRDFVDIFQKFKLSFNLLAKLKAHIHDPNAPELVHFLFTPLSLIYEASRDPYHGNQNLGDQAVAPVLTGEAKQLLLNCLTSKEIELWQALGKHWTTSRDEWQGHIPPYIPEFYDGWQPAAAVIDELASRAAIMGATPLPMLEPAPARTQSAIEDRQRGYNASRRPMAFPDDDRPVDRYRRSDDFDRNARSEIPHNKQVDRDHLSPGGMSRQDENNAFLNGLKRMGEAMIYEAAHDRDGKNQKELTVQRGDILQVLDNSKNWWKLRNYKGEVGFAPYTILKAIKSEEHERFQHFEQNGKAAPVPNGVPVSRTATSDTTNFGDERESSWRDYQRYQAVRRSSNSPQPDYPYSSSQPQIAPAGNWRRHKSFGPDSPRERSPSPEIRRNSQEQQNRTSASFRQRSLGLPDHARRSPSPQKRDPSLERHEAAINETGAPARTRTSPSFRGGPRPDVRVRRLSPPKYVPPPPPKVNNKKTPESFRYQYDAGEKHYVSAKTAKDNLHMELSAKLNSRQQRAFKTANDRTHRQVVEVTRINERSSENDVMDWLTNKGFSEKARDTFAGYTGLDMFQLHLSDLEDLLGHEEAIRLDGLLTLQRSASGYATKSAKELNDILRRRKENIEPEHEILPYQQRQEEEMRADADIEREDYPQQGRNTLRDQLVRQKGRLRQSQDFDFY
ncbi:hypothetical protein BsWGS_08125 [Bradybaena similaris]